MKDSFDELRGHCERVLTVFAHPDDMEIFCGGTVARFVASGASVRTVCMTDGSRGVRQRAVDRAAFGRSRVKAQFEAATALGVGEDQIFNLGFDDGSIEDELSFIEAVTWHVRDHRPDLVVTHEPSGRVHGFDRSAIWLNHRDHRKTAGVVFDAVYPFSRDIAFFPEQIAEGLFGHEVHNILFADAYQHPERIGIDVTNFLARKRQALESYLDDGSVTASDVEEFMTEGQTKSGWFETLGWWRDFH